MTGLRTSLFALSRPVTLASILVMLANDHTLKVVTPSWVTGKLSDFAGLFFFPFVVAAALSLAFGLAGRTPRAMGRMAFAGTAAWFALVKTVPWANRLTAQAAGWLVGGPVAIVLDPGDLLALVVLWPAWRIWRQAEHSAAVAPVSGVRRAEWAALALGLVACLATSPCLPVPRVVALASQDATLYAALAYPSSYAWRDVFASTDGGHSWEAATAGATDLAPQPPALPRIVCEPAPAQRCYRITGREEVEQSDDSGQSWHIAWSLPAGRRTFVERKNDPSWGPACGKVVHLGPYDLGLHPTGSGHTLVVALGNEGVLIRTPHGSWERYAVESARPTPYAAATLGEAMFILSSETLLWLFGAGLVLWQLCLSSWDKIDPSWRGSGIAILILGPLVGCGLFGAAWMLRSSFGPLYVLGTVLGIASIVLGPALVWGLMARGAVPEAAAWVRAAGVWSYATALLTFGLGWLPLVLWAFGLIPWYLLALVLALCLTGAIWSYGAVHAGRAAHAAAAVAASSQP